MARSFSQEARSDSQKIGETRYRMSHLPSTTGIARIVLLAGILLAVTVLASQSFFPAFAQEMNQMDEEIDYDENDTDPVVTYTAMDPEGEGVEWEVADGRDGTGTGTLDFDITDGMLTFKSSPDYEDPLGGDDDDSTTYIATITVKDTDDDIVSYDWTVTVNVMNVNEDGEVILSHPQPKEGTPLTVTLTDPDDISTLASTTWQWYRSETGTDPWAKIEKMATSSGSLSASYTPVEADVGNYLRATAMYFDDQDTDEKRTAHGVFDNMVEMEEYINTAPMFRDDDEVTAGSQITMSVPEDESLEEGDPVGKPITAKDLDGVGTQEVLTYKHDGTDAESFTIDSATGQFKLAAGTVLDFETEPSSYTVTVMATDPSRLPSSADVTITITDVGEAPTITEADAQVTYPEIDSDDDPNDAVVTTYTADDEDADDAAAGLKWSLSGRDAARFSITEMGPSGALTFMSSPDFEAPADSGRNNVYDVTVTVVDDAGNRASRNVTVTITNIEELGTLTLTSHPKPEVGQAIRVTLNDPDKVVGRVSWAWEAGTATSTQSGGTSASYTPRVEGTLSVTATYTDGTRNQRTLPLASPPSIQASQGRSDAKPVFGSSETGARTIAEDVTGDVPGDVISVTDSDDSTLLYTLSGSNAFTLDDRTIGQISVSDGTELDFEKQNKYTLTITATDPSGDSARKTVTITVTNVEEDPQITAGKTAVTYHENGIGQVEAYKAADDENDKARPRIPLTWSLASGGDSEDLSISQTGVLTFNSPPDFEGSIDANTDNIYEVTVTVSDGDTTTSDATLAVTVTVTNVDEDGVVSGLPAQPKEEAEIIVMLTDPDGPNTDDAVGDGDGTTDTLTDNASTTWQWFRSRSSRGPWGSPIATSTVNDPITNTRMPEAADAGHYLRATAMYSDGEGKNKVAHGITARAVLAKEYVNKAPMFPDHATSTPSTYEITMKVMEDNSLKAGDPVGDPVTAKDIGRNGTQEILIYTVTGSEITAPATPSTDQASFTIDRRTGQLKLAGADTTLDYENPADDGENNMYVVTVKAIDPSMASSTAVVTIEVEDVDEDPEFNDEDEDVGTDLTATSTLENTATTTLSSYTAMDDEDNNVSLKWSLSGDDEDKFLLCEDTDVTALCGDVNAANSNSETVHLRFKPSDYESPADTGTNNVYNVTVVATDSDDGTSERDVTVTVTNKDELGTVTMSHIQPEVGTGIRASLTDPDGGVRGITWEWFWCANDDSDCASLTKINTASATYTPIQEDAGDADNDDDDKYLQAKATYTDRTSTNNEDTRATSTVSVNPVQAEDATNQPPVLPDVTQTLKIDENSEADDAVYVVGLVAATDDPDDGLDKLLYTLSGTDAALFTIHSGEDVSVSGATTTTAGMIRLKSGTELDYETKKTYRVTVTATDPSLAKDTVAVTIEVNDVDEAPFVSKRGVRVTGPASVSHDENDPDAVQTYRAVGPDAANAAWRLSGADASAFSLSSGGVLSFDSPPDYEAATDAGTDNTYNVTVTASMGSFSDMQDVTVTVINVDEDGTVALTYDQNQVRVGVAITAEEPVDPDGDVSGVTWQWESSSDGSTGWSDISGATSAAYTPGDGDVDNFLRATASYTDRQGPGKSASSDATPSAVLATSTEGTPGTVALSPTTQLTSGNTVTAPLTDADNPTNQVWRWERSEDGSTSWTTISAATSASYTTTNADAGNYLRATVTYDDSSGAGQTAGPTATTDRVKLHTYDSNANGRIDRSEVIDAIRHYLFANSISREQVIEVIRLYLGL